MKNTLAEVRASLEGHTVSMLRDIVRKDSTIKGVSRMRKAELIEAAAIVVAKLNPEVVEAVSAEQEAEVVSSSPERHTEKRVYDFSECKEEKVLRKVLSGVKVDALEVIASSFAEIQLETKKKRPTKAELIDGIVCIYFPEAESKATGAETAVAMEPRTRVEVGQIYGKMSKSVTPGSDTPISTWISDAYLVLSRTEKYITVKDVSPYGSLWKTDKVKRFYVHRVSEDGYIPHEWIAQRKSANPIYQERIRTFDLMDADYVLGKLEAAKQREYIEAAERIYTRGEHCAAYDPEYWEEAYSDYAGDNSHPDDDTEIDNANSGTQSEASEHVLGRITFKYREKREEKTVECEIRSVPQTDSGNEGENYLRCTGATVWEIRDREGQLVAGYSPMLDIMQYSVKSHMSDLSIQDKIEKQFREQLPEMLLKAGLLDTKGELVSDGNEEFRVMFYKAWCIDETVKRGEDFEMPHEPFTQGNDPDNPLTWRASVNRTKALRVLFKKMYYQREKELRGHNKTCEQRYSKRIYGLSAELNRLYEEQAAV